MNKLQKGLMAVAVGLAFNGTVEAAPVFLPGLSDIELINVENVYRASTACTVANPCVAFDAANDPAGYQRADPNVFNNILPGDLFIGLVASRTIVNANAGTTWNEDNVAAGGIDTFSGYFVNKVHSFALNVDGTKDRILLETPTVDPFGVLTPADLAAGVSLKMWADTSIDPYRMNGLLQTTGSTIASATNGPLWGTLGIGATFGTAAAPALDPDGYVYAEIDTSPSGPLTSFTGQFYEAFNLIAKGPAYSAGLLTKINDPDEVQYGGAQLGDPVATAFQNLLGVCVPTATYGCYDIPGNGQLAVNQNVSPWQFASEDPLQLHVIPEPGSIALLGLGLGLAGLAGIRRRRNNA